MAYLLQYIGDAHSDTKRQMGYPQEHEIGDIREFATEEKAKKFLDSCREWSTPSIENWIRIICYSAIKNSAAEMPYGEWSGWHEGELVNSDSLIDLVTENSMMELVEKFQAAYESQYYNGRSAWRYIGCGPNPNSKESL